MTVAWFGGLIAAMGDRSILAVLRRLRRFAVLPALGWLVVHSLMLVAHAPSIAATSEEPDLYIAGERIVLCLAHGEADADHPTDHDEHWQSCQWCRGMVEAALPTDPSNLLVKSPEPTDPVLPSLAVSTPAIGPTAAYSSRAPPV
ncbi:MAG: hypothetical protein AAGC81_18460 [Pseudomonadota bacterium]